MTDFLKIAKSIVVHFAHICVETVKILLTFLDCQSPVLSHKADYLISQVLDSVNCTAGIFRVLALYASFCIFHVILHCMYSSISMNHTCFHFFCNTSCHKVIKTILC